MEMKKYLRYILIAVMTVGTAFLGIAAETADQMLKKASDAINGAGGLTASFTIDYGRQKISGTLKASGKKFALVTPSTSTWFDGKSMWTYNSKSSETTLLTPTPQEVAEANPLSIVNNYSSLFTASFAKGQIKGCTTIVLTPKNKQIGYKSVHVTIPDGSSFPSKLVIIPSSGQKVTVGILQVKTGQKLAESTFVYPQIKYPKAEIVDLR